jgi:hypothetical protein
MIAWQKFSLTLLVLRNSVAMEVVAMMASTSHLQLKKNEMCRVMKRTKAQERQREKCMSGVEKGKKACVCVCVCVCGQEPGRKREEVEVVGMV